MEKEVKEWREKVERLNNEIHNGQSQTINVEHKKNQYEIEIIDLKQTITVQKNEMSKLSADMSLSQKELCEFRQKNTALTQQVKRLKSLVENLDQNKEELIKRLQAASKDKKDEISDKAILQNDIANYKRDLLAKDQEIIDLKHSIASLDANLDEIQSELDQKTEDLALCRQKL